MIEIGVMDTTLSTQVMFQGDSEGFQHVQHGLFKIRKKNKGDQRSSTRESRSIGTYLLLEQSTRSVSLLLVIRYLETRLVRAVKPDDAGRQSRGSLHLLPKFAAFDVTLVCTRGTITIAIFTEFQL